MSRQSFDELGNPVPGGLNDVRLGPTSRNEICVTCGLDDKACTGHLSHVELPLPVYHPLLMDQTHLLLRSQCAHCQRLRMPEPEQRAAVLLLWLYKRGRWEEAQALEAKISAAQVGAKEAKKAAKDKATAKAAAAKRKAAAAKAAAKAAKEGGIGGLVAGEAMEVDFGSDDDEGNGSGEEEEALTAAAAEAAEAGVHEVLRDHERRLLGLSDAALRGDLDGGGGGGALSGDAGGAAAAKAAEARCGGQAQGEVGALPILSSHERSMKHRYSKGLLADLYGAKRCGSCGGWSPTVSCSPPPTMHRGRHEYMTHMSVTRGKKREPKLSPLTMPCGKTGQ